MASLREDYAVVSQSRFHALRMLWFSLKALLGRTSANDIFAVWSSNVAGAGIGAFQASQPERTHLVTQVVENEALPESAARLLASWHAFGAGGPCSPNPAVTVIIPVYNNGEVTVRCLQSVIDHWPQAATQLVIVDDASGDWTPALLRHLPGVDVIRNGVNSGFLRTCNRGAAIARGKYICFLNNDTIVTPGWLDELVRTAEEDESTVGAVGSKLIYPDGRLQEAGGLLWRDGSGWNYGRGGDQHDPKYNYVRNVDYCSGASLLVRSDLFVQLGGFSEDYAPAYYEDTDLCFAVRQLGYRVVYQPRSVIIHDEGTSSGVDLESGVKRYQVINGPKFRAKWDAALQAHLEHDPQHGMRAARRLGRPKTVMIIDSYVPEFDKDSGSLRLSNIIRQFQAIGFDVIFVPDNYFRSEPYTSVLQQMGVEVVYGTEHSESLATAVRERLPLVDLFWVSRPELGTKWLPILRERGDVPLIYDTLDLHYVREKRELDLKQIRDPGIWKKWEQCREKELQVMRAADVTIALTEVEKQIIESEGVRNTHLIPNVHELYSRTCSYGATDGVLFIGGYQHPPNVDAVVWLCQEIMPLVWSMRPDINVTLLGSNPPDAVKQLANARVAVPGYLHDVSPYFESARVFVAPLRYGAGLKGKVGQAFAHRVPTVTTQIGAEGFGIVNGEDAIVADDEESIARGIIAVYEDESLWNRLSEGASRRIQEYSPAATRARLEALISYALERTRSVV